MVYSYLDMMHYVPVANTCKRSTFPPFVWFSSFPYSLPPSLPPSLPFLPLLLTAADCCFSSIPTETSSQSSLTEQIRHGRLIPMLELGVTPSHVSLAVGEMGEKEEEREKEEEEGEEEGSYCIPLESLGLGGQPNF